MALHACLDTAAVGVLVGRFGIDDMTSCSVIDGGNENTSYCITASSGRYVLTIWDQKSLGQATRLAKLLVYLTNNGIRTSKVVIPPEEPIVLLHDDKPVMLKCYVEGEVTAELSGSLLAQLGTEMAALHEISAPSYLPNAFPYGRSYFPELLNADLDHTYVGWLSEKSHYLQERIPQDSPRALIHGDVFFDNVIVQDDQLMAIIDFEEASHYYRSFDLGMVIAGACRDRQGISFEKAGRFIRAYQNERPLESDEQKSLKVFAVYAAVATSFWRFRQYHVRRPEPRLHDQHVDMQTLADTIAAYPDTKFAELFG